MRSGFSRYQGLLGASAIALACARSGDEPRKVADAPLAPAAAEDIVVTHKFLPTERRGNSRMEERACVSVPCPSGSCRVRCPELQDMFHVDIQDLTGQMVILVDEVIVFDQQIPVITTTGLAARVGIRPRAWPAAVEVRVDQRSARANVDRATPYVAASAPKEGDLLLHRRAEPYHYD